MGGEILFGVGGGEVVNEFHLHRLSSCTTGRDIERNDKVCQKNLSQNKHYHLVYVMKKSFEIDLDLEGP